MPNTITADSEGNTLAKANVPIGGTLAFAPYDEENVIADTALGTTPLALPAAYKHLGLVKVDGAPQNGLDTEDATEFWQKGYSMPGDGTRTIQANLAESNLNVMELTEGKTPDVNGVIYVDSNLPAARVILFAATKFRNGEEERKNGVAQVTAIEYDQDTRGEVRGRSVTLTWREDPLFNGAPFKQFGPAAPTAGPSQG